MNSPQANPETRIPETRIPETRIDRALATLRHAQPRPGLEPRILQALESREAHTASPRRTRTPLQLLPSLPLAAWIAAGALALITVAALHLLRTHPKPQTLALTTPAPMPASSASSPHQAGWPILSRSLRKGGVAMSAPRTTPSSRPTSNLSSRPTSNLSSRPKAALFAAVAERPAGRIAATAQQLTREEAADLADLHAPSHPAPPLPLTPQEKVLLRLVRYGNTTQLATLNPNISAAHDAEEAAAFHAFFPDPPPIPQPGDTE